MATELISLGILCFCALIGGLVAARFRQPAVFGLLLVGAIIGPNSLNLVKDTNMINMMAEFGAILILFIVGLEFDMTKLVRLGARSLVIGLLKFAIVLFVGYQAVLLMGLSAKVALFIGVILSFSSTVVVVKVLEQKEMFKRTEVPLLIAVLIIEDIIAVVLLTFFSGLKNSSQGLLHAFESITFSIAILIAVYFIMMRFLSYIVNIFMRNSNEESVVTFLSLGIGALFSSLAYYLGVSPTAGAFLAGSLIASLPNAKDFGRAIHPYAMIFTSIFFISMGTLVNFQSIKVNISLIGVLLGVVLITRLISIGFLTKMLANFRNEQPFFASLAMIAVGEFSLLIAKESQNFGLGLDLVSITASLIFLSAVLMSFGINYSSNIHMAFAKGVPLRTRVKLENVSTYLRKFFDQMEIENYFTNKLKRESKLAFMLSLITIFLFFMLSKASEFAERADLPLVRYSFYAGSALMLFFLLRLIYNRLTEVHKTMASILTNIDASRNVKKCTRMLNHMLLSLGLFFTGLLFPFVIFVVNAGIWLNLLPFGLLLLGWHYIRSTMSMIDTSHYYTSYRPGLTFAKI